MSSTPKKISSLLVTLVLLSFQYVDAQEKISWLNDFTGESLIGSDTYQYDFTNVEGNDCKLNIEEQVTDKKGNIETRSWVFYLSDIDPSKISFKAKGKSLIVSMETLQSQKFITYYENGKIDGYTEEIELSMNEVDMARTFLETLREKITGCEETQTTWENRDQAFSWLVDNVTKATGEEIQWDQKFRQGSRDYLVDFEASSTNSKGEQESSRYTFDLTDIDPLELNLKISGTSLMVEVPVREGKRYVQVETPSGNSFTSELLIHAGDIELARKLFSALKYVVSNTTAERPQWDSYGASLEFLKNQLGEVSIGEDRFSYRLNFDASPSGQVELVTGKTDSKGSSESVKYAFYLTDMLDDLKLEVSKSSITVRLETDNKREFIREIADEKITDYTSAISFYVSGIDLARDILNAFENAIRNSTEKIEEFSSISEVGEWFSKNIGPVTLGEDAVQQNLIIDQGNENQLKVDKKLVESDGGSTESMFILYPEDISLEKLDIKVSGNKLSVPLATGTNKFIKNFENDKIRDFTSSGEILFSDPMAAKNFIAAIRFLKENSLAGERSAMDREAAMAFLSTHIQSIKLPDEQYDQKLDSQDGDPCKLSFTRVESNEKNPGMEYLYEFTASDIHSGNSKISVKEDLISINLVTTGNEKLIKPFKNGEPGDFIDDFIIYADDVLAAKKILAAFSALSEGCKHPIPDQSE
jgi:hypothetical protein